MNYKRCEINLYRQAVGIYKKMLIIEDNLKMFCYRGLKEQGNEKGYLVDTCLTAQDKYEAYLDYFRIAYQLRYQEGEFQSVKEDPKITMIKVLFICHGSKLLF